MRMCWYMRYLSRLGELTPCSAWTGRPGIDASATIHARGRTANAQVYHSERLRFHVQVRPHGKSTPRSPCRSVHAPGHRPDRRAARAAIFRGAVDRAYEHAALDRLVEQRSFDV